MGTGRKERMRDKRGGEEDEEREEWRGHKDKEKETRGKEEEEIHRKTKYPMNK